MHGESRAINPGVTLFKAFRIYVVVVASLMLLQLVFAVTQTFMNANFNAWFHREYPDAASSYFHFMGVVFFFSVFNVPVCVIAGIVFLATRRFKLAILSVSAAAAYGWILFQIGDSY